MTRMPEENLLHCPRLSRYPRSDTMLHEDITQKVIGAAMAVLNELRPGLDERLYENALVLELIARGHPVEQQKEYPVHYREHFIGKLIPDLIVDGAIIVDPKIVTAFSDSRVAPLSAWN